MSIDFYYYPGSCPCRAVMLTIKALDLEVNYKEIDLFKGATMTPEFIRMNPQHSVPTLDDDGFYVRESRAIMSYLVQQHGADDTLYPTDPKKRAAVDEKLYFDVSTLYARLGDYYYPVYFGGALFDEAKRKKIDEAFGFFDAYLESTEADGPFAAGGDAITIADLSLVATVSTYDVFGYDLSPYAHVTQWYETVKATAVDYEETNHHNCMAFKEMIASLSSE